MNGVFIWDIECVVKWNYHDKDESGDEESYTVTGKNWEEAVSKVKKIALSKSRSSKNDDEESPTFGKLLLPIEVSDFTKIKRGSWIDG
jgi:hypothetical protein